MTYDITSYIACHMTYDITCYIACYITYDIACYVACYMTYDITCYVACYICSGAVALNRHYFSFADMCFWRARRACLGGAQLARCHSDCSGAVDLKKHYFSLQICAFGVHGGPASGVRN